MDWNHILQGTAHWLVAQRDGLLTNGVFFVLDVALLVVTLPAIISWRESAKWRPARIEIAKLTVKVMSGLLETAIEAIEQAEEIRHGRGFDAGQGRSYAGRYRKFAKEQSVESHVQGFIQSMNMLSPAFESSISISLFQCVKQISGDANEYALAVDNIAKVLENLKSEPEDFKRDWADAMYLAVTVFRTTSREYPELAAKLAGACGLKNYRGVQSSFDASFHRLNELHAIYKASFDSVMPSEGALEEHT